MDMNSIVNIISSVGFPIVMCVLMFRYLEATDDKREQDTGKILETVNNNTMLISKLVEKFEDLVNNSK